MKTQLMRRLETYLLHFLHHLRHMQQTTALGLRKELEKRRTPLIILLSCLITSFIHGITSFIIEVKRPFFNADRRRFARNPSDVQVIVKFLQKSLKV